MNGNYRFNGTNGKFVLYTFIHNEFLLLRYFVLFVEYIMRRVNINMQIRFYKRNVIVNINIGIPL